MMDFVFDLQLFGFGGGDSSTTSREIPEQTANEKSLENYLLQSGSLGGNMAPYAYQAFAGSLNNTFTPNWNEAAKVVADRYKKYEDGYLKGAAEAIDDYRDMADVYGHRMQDAWYDYNDRSDKYLGQYEGAMGTAKSAYDTAVGKRASAWDDLVNGVLPSQYATNRQAALNADLKGTMGSAINNLASRGVINSGVGNKALDDISQSASDTLAKRYADDLQLEASLLGQDRQNALTDYNVASGHAGNLYGNQIGNAQSRYQVASDTLTNAANRYADMYKTRLGAFENAFQNTSQATKDLLSAAVTAQGASFEPSTQFLNYAGSLSRPTENLYNTMYSGRMGTGSTTTTKSDGGASAWGAVGSLGAAAIMCFTGDTLVTTPDGYKSICDVEPGDVVLSVHDGEIVPKKVESVTGPTEKEVIDVVFGNGQVWHTTRGQRYFGGRHFHFVEGGKNPVMVYDGEPTKVLEIVYSGRKSLVYDIRLEGFKGENVFFANDVAAEGFGE